MPRYRAVLTRFPWPDRCRSRIAPRRAFGRKRFEPLIAAISRRSEGVQHVGLSGNRTSCGPTRSDFTDGAFSVPKPRRDDHASRSDDRVSQSIALHCPSFAGNGPATASAGPAIAPGHSGNLRDCAFPARFRRTHRSSATGNKSQPRDLILQQLTQTYSKAMLELAMDSRINPAFEQIDHRTSRSICDAVGERLQQFMRPETELSPRLQQLINELRRRENERH